MEVASFPFWRPGIERDIGIAVLPALERVA